MKQDELLNVYTNQPSRQTGSRNVTGPKTLSNMWKRFFTHVISTSFNSILEL
jgi:hypothetical protein